MTTILRTIIIWIENILMFYAWNCQDFSQLTCQIFAFINRLQIFGSIFFYYKLDYFVPRYSRKSVFKNPQLVKADPVWWVEQFSILILYFPPCFEYLYLLHNSCAWLRLREFCVKCCATALQKSKKTDYWENLSKLFAQLSWDWVDIVESWVEAKPKWKFPKISNFQNKNSFWNG